MSLTRKASFAVVSITLVASIAAASWYDDYDAGVSAAKSGNWQAVVQKMSSAIKGNGKENDKARTYGAIFINYHPYYYRGVANLNLGRYDDAISDFEKASGPGEENLGSIGELIQRAKSKLAAAQAPEPQPQPPPMPAPQPRTVPVPAPVPQPVTPAAPVMDPALRNRAAQSIGQARTRMTAAQQRRATAAPQFSQGAQYLADANSRNAGARTNDDLNAVIAAADNAAMMFDAAPAPGAPPAPMPIPVPVPRATSAANAVLADYQPTLRRALRNYFNGEFESAAKDFQSLSNQLPNNGWIWAFLGASQYSQYAFEADESLKQQALVSFRKAKQYGRRELPDKYFSRRIRRAFENGG
jgi:tetratricopeptide (TPR) repeat protein